MSHQYPTALYAQTARTWAVIDTEALRHNLHVLAPLPGTLMPVVKADAYGHGVEVVATTCVAEGVSHLAVATVAEAEELRQILASLNSRADIYILSSYLAEEAEIVAEIDAIPMVSSWEQWESLQKASTPYRLPRRCFLMVDTGMGREGANEEQAQQIWKAASTASTLRITGIATHFSSADDPEADAITQNQCGELSRLLLEWGGEQLSHREDRRDNRGLWFSVHNSPAMLRNHILPDLPRLGRGTLYRPGAILYGIEPYRGAFAELPLRPLLSWYARVTLVKSLPHGATVGYGCTARLERPSRIATLSVGYADGLSRRLSNRGTVLLHGQRFPIVGRISMDQCQIDVTDAQIPVQPGDIATLIGTDGTETQSVLDIAELLDTTSHEPTCALSRRVPRLQKDSQNGVEEGGMKNF